MLPPWAVQGTLTQKFPRPSDGCLAHLYGLIDSKHSVVHLKEQHLPFFVGRVAPLDAVSPDTYL